MPKEIKVTDEQIRKLAEGLCGDAREAVEKAFPEVFEEIKRWKDITTDIKLTWDTTKNGFYHIHFIAPTGDFITFNTHQAPLVLDCSVLFDYKIEVNQDAPGCIRILKKC